MKYISHSLRISLEASPIRSFSEDKEKELFYPYRAAIVTTIELHYCPFCGKMVLGYSCGCEKFKNAFSQLQLSYDDKGHKSKFHPSEFAIQAGVVKPFDEFKIIPLSLRTILNLGPNIWDFSTRSVDDISGKNYLKYHQQNE